MARQMPESLLRTRTHITLYLLGALVMSLLAIQNVRYGFYDLFYANLLFVPLLLVGAMYGWARRNDAQALTGHLAVMVLLVLITGIAVLKVDAAAYHWTYVLGLFGFLVLPLKPAVLLNLGIACWIALALVIASGLYDSLRFLTSYVLLAGLAGMYAYLYHNKNRSLVELAIRDPLTGAYNLRHLEFTLRQEISRSESSGHPLSMIALEIDYFEQQLDAQGQDVINQLLMDLAKLLRSMTRAGDSVYYRGDGLFYIMLPFTPAEGSLVIAERIRRTVEERSWPVIDKVTVCLGCTTRLQGQTDAQALLEEAHQALRDAQAGGHNRLCHGQRKR